MTVLALLVWLTLRQYTFPAPPPAQARLAGFAAAAFLLLVAQIALGGWVSTNYAALACTDLPTCRGEWVPQMDIANAFHLFRELGREADGDLLSLDALVAIHWLHRVFAVIVAVALLALAARLYAAGARRLGIMLAAALAAQLTLGVLNVVLSLPLPVAAAHNAGAAAILVTMVVINFALRRRSLSAAASPLPVPAA
jgi:cytochrome c oxidase assembly protein subunit 15